MSLHKENSWSPVDEIERQKVNDSRYQRRFVDASKSENNKN